MICSECDQDHEKIKSEIDRRSRRYVYRDSEGGRWNGTVCPKCRNGYDLRRFEPNPATKRKCVICKGVLLKSHYFRCPGCLSNFYRYHFMPEDWGYEVRI